MSTLILPSLLRSPFRRRNLHPRHVKCSCTYVQQSEESKTSEFLNAHNTARESSGVPPLGWDRGLARFADKWAKQRKPDCSMQHSGGPYGENIFWYRHRKTWWPGRVVMKWFEERFSYDTKTNSCASGEMCGHYTQIVWRDTTAVGCARVKCDEGRGFLVVCEYNPRGNYEGESPFDQTQ
ncbi:hypothetical protein F2Q68_00002760 [Brassica cretica]|uniref:SCP domain-containing protein n=1 Tax=Brassica cretica TaxID=69181 RepID=A0A8S9J7P6_BRACR|nr:hypothetical protein F2Q68_00002760 [Brassica cretica]